MSDKQAEAVHWTQVGCSSCYAPITFGHFAGEEVPVNVLCSQCEKDKNTIAQFDLYDSQIRVLKETIRTLKGENLLLSSENVAMGYKIANYQSQSNLKALMELEALAKDMCKHCRCKMDLFPPDHWMCEWYKTQEWEHSCEDAGMQPCEVPEIHERIKRLKGA